MLKEQRPARRILLSTLMVVKILCVSLIIAPFESSNLGYFPPSANAQISFPFLTDDNFLTYENSTYGIKINYSSSWEVRTDPSFLTAPASQVGVNLPTNENVTMVASFQPPLIPDAFVLIVIENLNQTLDEVAKEAIGDLNNATLKANQAESGIQFSNVTFEGPARATLAGSPAYQIVRSASITVPPGILFEQTLVYEQKDLMIFTVKDQKLYTITFSGLGDGYNNHLATVQKMIDSFEILDMRNSTNNVI